MNKINEKLIREREEAFDSLCAMQLKKKDRDSQKEIQEAFYEMLAVLKDLQESAAYWSEYDVPLGIVDRINTAIEKAEGCKNEGQKA